MLGWHVSVYRTAEAGPAPRENRGAALGPALAVWQTGMYGLDWLKELVREGHALALRGNGYPDVFAARARYLLPEIADGPPSANPLWTFGPDDVITERWVGRTQVDADLVAQCHPDEWLIVHAWDES